MLLFDDKGRSVPGTSTMTATLLRVCRAACRAAVTGSTAILLLLLVSTAAAYAESQAGVESREENGFGRIVFSFDRLPPYSHAVDAGILVLSFEDPVSAELEEIPKDLPDYIGLARRDPDGRAFRFALNRSFRVNLMEAGDQLFLDILPPGWKGAPPSLPSHVIKTLSRLAAETERQAREEARQREAAKHPYKLTVRLARYPTFSRIVFDGNKFVKINLDRQGSQIRVAFDAQSDVDLSELKTDPPKFLRDVKLEKTGSTMAVVMMVDDDVDVRGFRQSIDYVVDLSGPELAAAASAQNLAQVLGNAPAALQGKLPPDATDQTALPAETRAEPDPEAAEDTGYYEVSTTALDAENLSAEILGDTAEEEAAKAPEAVANEQSERAHKVKPAPRPAKEKETAATVKSLPAGKPTKDPTVDDAPNKAKGRKPPLPVAPAAVARDRPEAPVALGEAGAIRASVADVGGNLRLSFPFTKQVAAAAFRRGRTIWLAFDTDEPLDIQAIRDAQGGKLTGVQHVRSGPMQYMRLALSRGWLSHVSSDENAWIVDIGEMVGGHAQPLRLERKLRDDKRSVVGINVEKPGRVHWLNDPELGDRLAVVTVFPPQRNVPKPQEFVEFRSLATAHGIAVRPHSDDLAVRLKLDEVVITRRNGLTLSAGDFHQYEPGRKPLSKAARIGFIDFGNWRIQDSQEFSSRVHEIQRQVALSPSAEKNRRRFDLARLYFANARSMESVGVMRRMSQIDPALENDPSFNILRGAALTRLGRSEEARKDLEVHALAHDQDAALWRGLIDTAGKNWEAALQNFAEGGDAIGSYVDDVQARFRLAAARAALQMENLSRAAEELNAIPDSVQSSEVQQELALLRGWYLEKVGRIEEAQEKYAAVISSDQRPAAAEAELRNIQLQVREGELTRPEALKRLERLQLTWRGDDVELETMHLLSRLYVQEGHYREAFNIMKNGVQAFPKSRLALLMQDEMKQVFRDLYLRDSIDGLTTFQSLALYYDYRELTPVGRQGDEMIRRLADKLIEFDLLDQAAELLDHQVNKRLKGAARSQVATRLAMVHLMNHKPDLALRVIRQTRQAGLPTELRRSRSLLEARALGELGRAEAAIEILNTLGGEDVERLKADALWSSQQWLKAGSQLEKMLGARWQDSAVLEERERFDVLRTAISYSLAGDQFALDRVRKKFYEKMIKTSDAESFVLVTKPVTSQGVSFRELAREIAAIDTLEGFMKEFRARYDSSPDTAKTTSNRSQQPAG